MSKKCLSPMLVRGTLLKEIIVLWPVLFKGGFGLALVLVIFDLVF